MNETSKAELVKAYDSKILAIRLYKSSKQEFRVNDFLDPQALSIILEEITTGESDITPAGKAFLEQYYGNEELTRNMVPMETLRFIEESKGNIQPGQGLREELLPPNGDLE
jgi:hypothetical protein